MTYALKMGDVKKKKKEMRGTTTPKSVNMQNL